MENDVQEQIEKRLAELPEDVRRAILSAELEKQVQDIGAKYQLHIDQVGHLGDEVMLVMLGFSSPGEFVDSIIKEVLVTPAQADDIATDVVNQIFTPVRDSMKKFMEERAAKAAAPKPPAAPLTMPVSELMLAGKTVVVAPAVPAGQTPSRDSVGTSPLGGASPAPKPISKADPYREPVE